MKTVQFTSHLKHIGIRSTLAVAAVALSLAMAVSSATAATGPVWRIDSMANTTASMIDDPSTVVDEHRINYIVEVANFGDVPTELNAPYALAVDLPSGLSPIAVSVLHQPGGLNCAVLGEGFECTDEADVPDDLVQPTTAGRSVAVLFSALVDPGAAGTLTARMVVSGGGAGEASTLDPTRIAPPPPFGIDAFDMQTLGSRGENFAQAGGHPAVLRSYLDFNTIASEAQQQAFGGVGRGDLFPAEATKDTVVTLPEGFIGNPSALQQCSLGDLVFGTTGQPESLCAPGSQVGTAALKLNALSFEDVRHLPIFNMVPPPGVPARFAFDVSGTVVTLDVSLRSDDYRLTVSARNISKGLAIAGTDLAFWGLPADGSHDRERDCPGQTTPHEGGETCAGSGSTPFFRMPTSCPASSSEGLDWRLATDSWSHPGLQDADGRPVLSDARWAQAEIRSHDLPGYPASPADPSTPWGAEQGMVDCADVPAKGSIEAAPTALDTESPSGLTVHVEVPNPGLENAKGVSTSDIKAVKVALPQGVTIDPSQAEGLGVCAPAQYESSELSFHPDGQHGCPANSKIGTVEVKTPLLEEALPGDVYVAKPYDNPFGSLLALYIVIENPQRGILVKLPGELRTNEVTGRIEGEFDDLPQIPFSTFDFHLREGARAPLVTPPTCGTYTTEAEITPWSDPAHPIASNSSFEILHGIGGGPCPPNGTPGFKPHFSAGSINNNAGSFSPFDMRITRNDGEQDMTRFSAVLPPGVLGKLAGVAKCPESAIATAKSKSGLQEIASPSCPANSEIGHSIVGAGVGSVLTYVPGKVYLGGPFHGDPLSVIAITPVVAGPFDVGTVVVHEALTLNPKTAEVEVDGSASDPIPHILKGIPAKLRDLRVYVDRPDFTLNPTSCDPSSAKATLFGGGGNAFSTLDDVPVALSDRYQAASCASLGFKPGLTLHLKGGTKRGGHPALQADYKPRSGDANVKGLVVRLPRSAFLDQAHIRTICTRVQFAAKQCPPKARYGYIKAWTPLLEEPLEGPVWLRSSDHKLPDLVFDLHGLVDIEVATRIDSIHGGVRASVGDIPDAPLSKVVLKMQGAKKGLIVNSRDLCGSTNKANAQFEGQNGKEASLSPVMRADCGGARKHKGHRG